MLPASDLEPFTCTSEKSGVKNTLFDMTGLRKGNALPVSEYYSESNCPVK